jgi:hypothetical protein
MPGDYNSDYGLDFSGPAIPQDFNHDYNSDFAGGFINPPPPPPGNVISKDFNYDYNSDFAGGYTPGIIVPPPPLPVPGQTNQLFPSEYIAVPANRLIQVRVEYRTIKIQPEGW